MEIIKVYGEGTPERDNLEKAAYLFTRYTGKPHKVEDVYFDLGQNWMWTTISREDDFWGGIQILYPADYEGIIYANTYDDLVAAVKAKCRKEGWKINEI